MQDTPCWYSQRVPDGSGAIVRSCPGGNPQVAERERWLSFGVEHVRLWGIPCFMVR